MIMRYPILLGKCEVWQNACLWAKETVQASVEIQLSGLGSDKWHKVWHKGVWMTKDTYKEKRTGLLYNAMWLWMFLSQMKEKLGVNTIDRVCDKGGSFKENQSYKETTAKIKER